MRVPHLRRGTSTGACHAWTAAVRIRSGGTSRTFRRVPTSRGCGGFRIEDSVRLLDQWSRKNAPGTRQDAEPR
ncbi:hypothetical protein [Streptomyces sp. HPF1205]|uniref:hypothetical protein n=1 Tax=Streptomyces sp. HPF1205 TaxID=2873262 RepID=UPI001CECB693|nr:hypothetical protein [Streptomyces sp. HPF1205]